MAFTRLAVKIYDEHHSFTKCITGCRHPFPGAKTVLVHDILDRRKIYFLGICVSDGLGDEYEKIYLPGFKSPRLNTLGFGQGGTFWTPNATKKQLYDKACAMVLKHAIFHGKNSINRGKDAPIPLEGCKWWIPIDKHSLTFEERLYFLRELGRVLWMEGVIPDIGLIGLDSNFAELEATMLTFGIPEMIEEGYPAAHGVSGLGEVPFDDLELTGKYSVLSLKPAYDYIGGSVKGKRAVINGIGGPVGRGCMNELLHQGATIVAASDKVTKTGEVIYDADGLDPKELCVTVALRKANPKKYSILDYKKSYRRMNLGEELSLDCDILVLAGGEYFINEENAKDVKAHFALEAANLPISRNGWKVLYEKKPRTRVIPYFAANSAATFSAFIAMKYRHSLNLYDKLRMIDREMKYHFLRVIPLIFEEAEKNKEPEGIAATRIAIKRFNETAETRKRKLE